MILLALLSNSSTVPLSLGILRELLESKHHVDQAKRPSLQFVDGERQGNRIRGELTPCAQSLELYSTHKTHWVDVELGFKVNEIHISSHSSIFVEY